MLLKGRQRSRYRPFSYLMSTDLELPSVLGQGADHDVFVIDDTLGIVALEGDGAAADFAAGRLRPVVRLRPGDGRLAVDPDNHVLALDPDVIIEPLAVGGGRVVDHIHHAVEAARLFAVLMRGVHLAFVSCARPAFFLVFGVEVDAGIGARFGFYLGLELEIREVGVVDRSDVEQMASRPVHHDHPVLDGKGTFILTGLPAIERLAVEKTLPLTPLRRGLATRQKQTDKQQHKHELPGHFFSFFSNNGSLHSVRSYSVQGLRMARDSRRLAAS